LIALTQTSLGSSTAAATMPRSVWSSLPRTISLQRSTRMRSSLSRFRILKSLNSIILVSRDCGNGRIRHLQDILDIRLVSFFRLHCCRNVSIHTLCGVVHCFHWACTGQLFKTCHGCIEPVGIHVANFFAFINIRLCHFA